MDRLMQIKKGTPKTASPTTSQSMQCTRGAIDVRLINQKWRQAATRDVASQAHRRTLRRATGCKNSSNEFQRLRNSASVHTRGPGIKGSFVRYNHDGRYGSTNPKPSPRLRCLQLHHPHLEHRRICEQLVHEVGITIINADDVAAR